MRLSARPFVREGLVAIAAAFVLSGCGGGGGGGDSASPSAPPAQPTATVATVASFAPASGTPGATITVTGTGFTHVTGVSIGSATTAFTLVDDSHLTLAIPAAAVTAPIVVVGSGFTVSSTTSLTVVGQPVVTSVSALQAPVGGTLTVSGQRLDRVVTFQLAGQILTASARSSTSVSLTMPATPATGLLELVLDTGAQLATVQRLVVFVPAVVTSFSPTSGPQGSTITVTGTGLDGVTSLSFANGVVIPVTPTSPTRLTFTWPVDAQSGPLTLVTPFERSVSATRYSVIDTVAITRFSVTSDAAGSVVTIDGSGLATVTAATVGSATQPISVLSDTRLVITAGATAEGQVVLSSSSGDLVAGSFTRAAAQSSIAFTRLETAQPFARDATDAQQVLSRNKPVLVRAYLVAGAANAGGAMVQLTALSNGSVLGVLPMPGPATLPTVESRYDTTTTFDATVPAAWIVPGVQLRVDAIPAAGGVALSRAVTPVIAGAMHLSLVIVPIVVGGLAPTVPSTSDIAAVIARSYPYAVDDVAVSVHAPYAFTSGARLTDSDWNRLLMQIDDLRWTEAPGSLYYGLVATAANGASLTGLGYIPSLDSASDRSVAFSSIGIDDARMQGSSDPFGIPTHPWAMTMVHEIGHNHSRQHAPCGAAGGPDPAYPYPAGHFGPQALWDAASNMLTGPEYGSAPSFVEDVMGYCNGQFFSDFNYVPVRQFAVARTAANGATTSNDVVQRSSLSRSTTDEPLDAVLLSGSVTSTGAVSFESPITLGRRRIDLPAGQARLVVTNERGETIRWPVELVRVGDSLEGARHFHAVLPDPGRIMSLRLE